MLKLGGALNDMFALRVNGRGCIMLGIMADQPPGFVCIEIVKIDTQTCKM